MQNISPETFLGSAIIIGYFLSKEVPINEQDAIGNWLMLVGQFVTTNVSYTSLLEEQVQEKKKDIEIEAIKEVLEKMKNELDKIKNPEN